MLKIELARAIDENNQDAVAHIKKELIGLWKSIISIEPKTLDERQMLGLFLLDQLSETTPDYEIKMIRKKIIELFWEKPAKPKDKVEVVQLRKVVSGN